MIKRTVTLQPGARKGTAAAPASKSHAHRLLICAALGKRPASLICREESKDIAATKACLNALCADIIRSEDGCYEVKPCIRDEAEAVLRCGESGSTLRFLLPVCGALKKSAVFRMEGRLPNRPLAPLDALLTAHGMELLQCGDELHVRGNLQPGEYEIPGNISSQYISGLLFALPLLDGDSTLTVTGKVESRAYITMTESALQMSGIRFEKKAAVYHIPGRQQYALPCGCEAEGDCSNAAFFLCMGAFSKTGITVSNVPEHTGQGDRAVLQQLHNFGAEVTVNGNSVSVRTGALHGIEIDAAEIPDLVPVLAVTAAGAAGDTRITHAERLRLKESDRIKTTAALIRDLGGSVEELEDGLLIHGIGGLRGGTVNACNDHRIAMAAAVGACISRESVTILGAECIAKSFPDFFERYQRLELEI